MLAGADKDEDNDNDCEIVTQKHWLNPMMRMMEKQMWIKYNNYVADYDLFAMITMNIFTLQISKSASARSKQYGCC